MQNINVNINNSSQNENSSKNWWVTLILCIVLGVFGMHRFYINKGGTGIVYALSFGLCGVGVLIDLIMILTGSFRDGYGRLIKYGCK